MTQIPQCNSKRTPQITVTIQVPTTIMRFSWAEINLTLSEQVCLDQDSWSRTGPRTELNCSDASFCSEGLKGDPKVQNQSPALCGLPVDPTAEVHQKQSVRRVNRFLCCVLLPSCNLMLTITGWPKVNFEPATNWMSSNVVDPISNRPEPGFPL